MWCSYLKSERDSADWLAPDAMLVLLISSDLETPWLDGQPCPHLSYQGGWSTFLP